MAFSSFLLFLSLAVLPVVGISQDTESLMCEASIATHGACCVWLGDDLLVFVKEGEDTFQSVPMGFEDKLQMCGAITAMKGA